MGGEGVLDWTCDECSAHRYHCCECGAETIGESGEEMCERCFRRLVEMDGVIRTAKSVLDGEALDKMLAALRRDYPRQHR